MNEFEENFILEELRLRQESAEFWPGRKGEKFKKEMQELYGDSFDFLDFLDFLDFYYKKQKDE